MSVGQSNKHQALPLYPNAPAELDKESKGMADFDRTHALLRKFKGDRYLHGMGVLSQVGSVTAGLGRRAALVCDVFPGADAFVETIKVSLSASKVEVLGEIEGARPNAPREDLARIAADLTELDPDVVLSFGGGSTIDATKAAEVLRILGGDIEAYFGTGLVTQALADSGKELTPHVAIQTAASSGAHLTKYSNITDVMTGQKKLIVDEAIVPAQPVFDYEVTYGAPASLTADGALDGVAHCLEVLYGAVGKPYYAQMEEVAREGIGLVVKYLPKVMETPRYAEGREALGLATDLGGYAIMIGGTNGGHLTSFSLVDILSHGRACAIMNPYYTVFFAPAIQGPLMLVGKIFAKAGYTDANIESLSGRELGVAVAEAMIAFEKRIGFPATLGEVPGFSDAHVERALVAAKNPQLKMKLENMPVPLTTEMVEEYMGPVLQAAKTGELDIIKNVT
jgi:alcohol dehydrogenase